jgi:hypothetical protein
VQKRSPRISHEKIESSQKAQILGISFVEITKVLAAVVKDSSSFVHSKFTGPDLYRICRPLEFGGLEESKAITNLVYPVHPSLPADISDDRADCTCSPPLRSRSTPVWPDQMNLCSMGRTCGGHRFCRDRWTTSCHYCKNRSEVGCNRVQFY